MFRTVSISLGLSHLSYESYLIFELECLSCFREAVEALLSRFHFHDPRCLVELPDLAPESTGLKMLAGGEIDLWYWS